MIWLLLSIICATLVMVVFKFAERYKVDRLQLIVINYFIAFLSGLIAFHHTVDIGTIHTKPWFYYALVLGVVFISCFNIIGYAIQQIGVGIITVANKMSMVIPVLFSLLVVGERLSWFTGMGIVLAIIAVYFSSVRPKHLPSGFHYWKLPIVVFIISGFVDTYIKYMQEYIVSYEDFGMFCTLVFLSAGTVGLPVFIYKQIKRTDKRLFPTVWSGVLLGVPNFGSIYFLMEALNSPNWESSQLFPLNHIGVVLLATISGVVFFREALSRINKIGVALAIMSILLLSMHG